MRPAVIGGNGHISVVKSTDTLITLEAIYFLTITKTMHGYTG